MRNVIASVLIASALLLPVSAAAQTAATTAATTATTTVTKAATPMGAMSMVNVNKASAADLTKIPGVSSKIAAEIIKNRPYKNADELVKKVKGIGKNNIKKMLPMLSF